MSNFSDVLLFPACKTDTRGYLDLDPSNFENSACLSSGKTKIRLIKFVFFIFNLENTSYLQIEHRSKIKTHFLLKTVILQLSQLAFQKAIPVKKLADP